MRLTRLHVAGPLRSANRYALPQNAARHLIRVLRSNVGDPLILFDGSGGEYAARIHSVQRDDVEVDVGKHDPIERESPLHLTLLQGVSRGERMDWVVQKATELGVTAIVPLLTARSVVSLPGVQADKKVQHWRAIAIGACEQSGRNRVPQIAVPASLQHYLGSLPQVGSLEAAAQSRLLLSPLADTRLIDAPLEQQAVTLLIGPEGGLAKEEQELARLRGFLPVRLGPRMLRTETAAVSALTVLQQRCGDL
jgi:16S rRNA (uracil1498-N3)-methyltransferase